jgi:hypothetical protein
LKERLLTLGLAAGALLLFYALMVPQPMRPDQAHSEPLSTDAGSEGELALWRWLQAEHIPTDSLRYRYDYLLPKTGSSPRPGEPPSTGNVLITVMPHQVPMRADEQTAIRRWVSAGNTLLILAALDDTPLWSQGSEGTLLQELRQLSNLTFSMVPEESPAPRDGRPRVPRPAGAEPRRYFSGGDVTLEPRDPHPLLEGVQAVQATSPLPSARWLADDGAEAPLILLRRQDSQTPALWLLRAGEGQILLSSFASVASNAEIDKLNNARWLANIIRWGRADNGRVIFDDMHQGLSAYYDPRAFFADPRLHRTLGWLLLLWLAFVLGPLPLRSAHSPWAPVDEAALVEASGRFYSAAVPRREAARRLLENFFNGIRRRLNLPESGAPLWEWLQTQSRVSERQRLQLQHLFDQAQAGTRVNLTRLQRLLTDIQGSIV